jgi:hypothetical protein
MRLLMAADALAAYLDHNKRFNVYVDHCMKTKTFCKWGLPYANFLDFLALDPCIQTGIKRGPHMQIFAYGDLVTKSPYAYNNHMQTVSDWTIPICIW